MSAVEPVVDVNLLVFNAVATIGPAIESVLAQTWPALTLTVLDNGSTDGTVEVVRQYMRDVPRLRLHAARANAGGVVNCARAFTFGDADFVMPKTADDLIAPGYVERLMAVMLARPDCAMCHAGAIVFTGEATVRHAYPPVHRLHAVGGDARARARHVMAHYTSAPSFWGVFRRRAVDQLAAIRYRAGWDHALLAELALYGEIRHVPEVLYFRRDFGKPVDRIARAATEAAQRGLDPEDGLADLHWMTPLITTAHTHVDMFAVARLDTAARAELMEDAARIFRQRWLPQMRREAAAFRAVLPALSARATATAGLPGQWMLRQIAEAAQAVATILPDEVLAETDHAAA